MARDSNAGAVSAFSRWLLQSQPAVGGPLRFVFYGGSLFLFVVLNAPWNWAARFASVELYSPKGLMGWMGFPHLPQSGVWALLVLTLAAWFCATVG